MKLYICVAALLQTKHASAGTSRDNCRAQGHDKSDTCTVGCDKPSTEDAETKFNEMRKCNL